MGGPIDPHRSSRAERAARSRGALAQGSEQRPSTSLGTSEVGFVLLLAALWIATEWLRATLFTGFAWNPLAAIWVPVPVAQAALGNAGANRAVPGIRSEVGSPETTAVDKGAVTRDIIAAPEGDGQDARAGTAAPTPAPTPSPTPTPQA